VRRRRKGPKPFCGCETRNYESVELYRAQGKIKQRPIASLAEVSDLGELSAPEIALEDAKKRFF